MWPLPQLKKNIKKESCIYSVKLKQIKFFQRVN